MTRLPPDAALNPSAALSCLGIRYPTGAPIWTGFSRRSVSVNHVASADNCPVTFISRIEQWL